MNDARILRANGTHEDIQPANGTDFQLAELQEIVGGLIEIIHLGGGGIIVIDEEGKLKSKPVNRRATNLARFLAAIHPDDAIVGDALICPDGAVKQ